MHIIPLFVNISPLDIFHSLVFSMLLPYHLNRTISPLFLDRNNWAGTSILVASHHNIQSASAS